MSLVPYLRASNLRAAFEALLGIAFLAIIAVGVPTWNDCHRLLDKALAVSALQTLNHFFLFAILRWKLLPQPSQAHLCSRSAVPENSSGYLSSGFLQFAWSASRSALSDWPLLQWVHLPAFLFLRGWPKVWRARRPWILMPSLSFHSFCCIFPLEPPDCSWPSLALSFFLSMTPFMCCTSFAFIFSCASVLICWSDPLSRESSEVSSAAYYYALLRSPNFCKSFCYYASRYVSCST